MLSINHSSSLFYRIDLQKLGILDKETKKLINHINLTWGDIEYLNYLFSRNFGKIADDPEKDILFSSLVIMSNSFYIYLGIIHSLLRKIIKIHKEISTCIFSFNKEYFDKIEIIRNHILIHKEKPNFKDIVVSMSATDSKNMIEYHVFVINGKTKEEEIYLFKPVEDIIFMHKILNEMEMKLSSKIK